MTTINRNHPDFKKYVELLEQAEARCKCQTLRKSYKDFGVFYVDHLGAVASFAKLVECRFSDFEIVEHFSIDDSIVIGIIMFEYNAKLQLALNYKARFHDIPKEYYHGLEDFIKVFQEYKKHPYRVEKLKFNYLPKDKKVEDKNYEVPKNEFYKNLAHSCDGPIIKGSAVIDFVFKNLQQHELDLLKISLEYEKSQIMAEWFPGKKDPRSDLRQEFYTIIESILISKNIRFESTFQEEVFIGSLAFYCDLIKLEMDLNEYSDIRKPEIKKLIHNQLKRIKKRSPTSDGNLKN